MILGGGGGGGGGGEREREIKDSVKFGYFRLQKILYLFNRKSATPEDV